mmetsp:Transcript_13037/g.24271  ORF Transcript_13037/g.24271 Transcript_13037/m.24271 type:complete len:213 (-) Transcript_13037:738-1376(-)
MLRNNIESPVAFKIKTTAPRSYVVKPNHGLIMPSQTATIQISMTQSSDQQETKHKFQVLSCKANLGSNATQDEVKRLIDNCAKSAIQQIKLDVAFATFIEDNRPSLYEEAIDEPRRSVGLTQAEPRSSYGQTSGGDSRLKKAPLEQFVKKKIDEKLELERKLRRLQDEENERLKKSASIAKTQGKNQNVTFLHIFLSLLAGILVGYTLLRSS